MKIRSPRLIKTAAWMATWFARGVGRTLRFELRNLGATCAPLSETPRGSRYLYALWHEGMLLPIMRIAHPDAAILASKHADGQLIAKVIEAVGMGVVYGSTNRDGLKAVRGLIDGSEGRRHLVVTPDGPRGPRRVAQPGVVYIASRTGMQLVAVGVGYHRPWRAKSWDKFAIPRPCSRARMIFGEPITIPDGLKVAALEEYRVQVQAEMDRLTDAAERWAETNRFDLPATPQPSLRLAS